MTDLRKVPDDAWLELTAGEVLFRQGEEADRVFFVERGEVEAIREINGSRLLRRYGSGDFLGEDAVLLQSAHRSTARVTEDSRLLAVDGAALFELLQNNPEIALRMMRTVSRRLVELEESRPTAANEPPSPAAVAEPPSVSPSAPPPVPAVPASGPAEPSSEADATASTPTVLVHEESGARFELDSGDEFVIGRLDPATGESPDIDLEKLDTSHSVSRRHARLRRSAEGLVLVEEKPTANGTFVNGSQIETGQEIDVANGDELQFGLVVLTVRAG